MALRRIYRPRARRSSLRLFVSEVTGRFSATKPERDTGTYSARFSILRIRLRKMNKNESREESVVKPKPFCETEIEQINTVGGDLENGNTRDCEILICKNLQFVFSRCVFFFPSHLFGGTSFVSLKVVHVNRSKNRP